MPGIVSWYFFPPPKKPASRKHSNSFHSLLEVHFFLSSERGSADHQGGMACKKWESSLKFLVPGSLTVCPWKIGLFCRPKRKGESLPSIIFQGLLQLNFRGVGFQGRFLLSWWGDRLRSILLWCLLPVASRSSRKVGVGVSKPLRWLDRFLGSSTDGGWIFEILFDGENSCTSHDARNLVNSYQVGRLSATHDRLAEWISVATSCSPGYGIADVAGRSKDLFWSMVLGAAV